MKVYRLGSSHIWANTLLGNLLMVAMLIWAVIERINGATEIISLLLLIILPIVLISALVGNHQPTEIVVTEDSITFAGLGRRYTYDWKTLKYLHVKRFFLGDRYLVQIGDFRAFSGRYWIPNHMEGQKELEAFLKAKEQQIRNR